MQPNGLRQTDAGRHSANNMLNAEFNSSKPTLLVLKPEKGLLTGYDSAINPLGKAVKLNKTRSPKLTNKVLVSRPTIEEQQRINKELIMRNFS